LVAPQIRAGFIAKLEIVLGRPAYRNHRVAVKQLLIELVFPNFLLQLHQHLWVQLLWLVKGRQFRDVPNAAVPLINRVNESEV
jgi:hypothetical protein